MSASGAIEIKPILAAINEINDFLITTEFNLDSVLDMIIKKAMELSGGKYGQILLFDGQDLVIAATTGVVEKGVRLFKENCVCGLVAEKKEALIIDEVKKEKRYHRFFEDAKSELAVPLLKGDKVLGVINMESPQRAGFNEHHRDLMETFALQAAHAIKIAMMYDQQKALAEIDRVLASLSSEPAEVYEMIIQKSLRLIGGRSGQLLLKEGEELVIAATTGQEKPKVTRVHIDSCVSGIAVKKKAPLNVGDVTKKPYSSLYKSYLGTMKSELVIPLMEKEEVIGVLNFENPIESFFDDEHVRILLSMADHATVAIRNMQLYQRFQRGLHDVKRLLRDMEDFPDKMKNALKSFHIITEFFDAKEKHSGPFLFPPTEDY